MNTQYKQALESKQGFTIIEVVLVLAIAALIFLMVFIALPALQKGQRDTARKNDASLVATAISSYKSNNKGSVDVDSTNKLDSTKLQAYLGKLNQYEKTDVTVNGARNVTGNQDVALTTIKVFVGSSCDSVPAPSDNPKVKLKKGSSSRAVAVVAALEGSDKPVGHCQDA